MSNQKPPRPSRGFKPRTFADITGCYQDQELLEFVIPDLERDAEKGICLTVRLAQGHPDPFIGNIYPAACRFFDDASTLADRAIAGDGMAHARLLDMLSFPEAPEIRFGYTGDGHDGNGIGGGNLKARVSDYYMRFSELRSALRVQPDALQMVPLIGMDRVSDAMATVCKKELIAFTQRSAQRWSFAPACMRHVSIGLRWSRSQQVMVPVFERMPVDDGGRAILLVPTFITRSGEALGGSDYFQDLGPKGPKSPRDGSSKEAALKDAQRHPGRLVAYASEALKIARPRRDLFPKPKKRK